MTDPGEGPAGLWRVIKTIPRGRVSSYGDVGRALDSPVSGLLVGRWLVHCAEGVPWWRVVGRDGTLLIGKRDPAAAKHQEERLRAEGITFTDDRVDMEQFAYYP